MLLRAMAVWVGLIPIAIANAGVRTAWLTPRFGEHAGHVLSTVTLSTAILLVAWLTIGWIGPRTAAEALRVGIGWMLATVAFEFLAGHYAFGNPWSTLLADYDLTRGRVWVLVLLTLLAAPWVAAALRHRLQR
jgi:hypothetical protein